MKNFQVTRRSRSQTLTRLSPFLLPMHPLPNVVRAPQNPNPSRLAPHKKQHRPQIHNLQLFQIQRYVVARSVQMPFQLFKVLNPQITNQPQMSAGTVRRDYYLQHRTLVLQPEDQLLSIETFEVTPTSDAEIQRMLKIGILL